MIVSELSDIGQPYPPKGWDMPRRYVSITPDEVLYDHMRVLSSPASRLTSMRYTILQQPRLETTAMRMETFRGLF